MDIVLRCISSSGCIDSYGVDGERSCLSLAFNRSQRFELVISKDVFSFDLV